MKSLLLVRHAKSSWADAGLSDFDRPLNERGKKDAPVMAQRLINKQIQIDGFITSTAVRARETCTYFVNAFKKTGGSLILKQELYLASPETFYKCISEIDDVFSSVAVFAHNSGIAEFANSLTHTKVDDMPTCSIFGVRIAADSWKNFSVSKKEYLFFHFPKQV